MDVIKIAKGRIVGWETVDSFQIMKLSNQVTSAQGFSKGNSDETLNPVSPTSTQTTASMNTVASRYLF